MSLRHLSAALAVMAGFALACTTSGEPDLSDTAEPIGDTGLDTADTDTGSSEVYVYSGWRGEATVVPQTSYLGTEQFYVGDATTGETLCVHQWDMQSTAIRSDCPDCDWAFTIEGTKGTQTEGDCTQLGAPEVDIGPYHYGFGTIDYGGSDYDVLFYYSSYWSYVALASFKDPTFTYDWSAGYAYY